LLCLSLLLLLMLFLFFLQTMPQPGNAALQELLASTVRSKQRGLEVASDWKQQATGVWTQLSHICTLFHSSIFSPGAGQH
jgi:hypothetical protein